MRGVLADALAVAGEAVGAFARAVLVGEADVHQADRLFGSSAAGASDAGDSDADEWRRCVCGCRRRGRVLLQS